MFRGDPNQAANPFAPAQPQMNRNLNTFAGNQQAYGRMAPQSPTPAYQRASGMNAQIMQPTQMPGMYQTPQQPMQTPFAGPQQVPGGMTPQQQLLNALQNGGQGGGGYGQGGPVSTWVGQPSPGAPAGGWMPSFGQPLPSNIQQLGQPNPQQALTQLMQLLQQGIY